MKPFRLPPVVAVLFLSALFLTPLLSAQSTVLNLECTPTSNPGEYLVTWDLPPALDFSEIRILENDVVLAVVPGTQTSFTTTSLGSPLETCAGAETIGFGERFVSNQVPFVCVESVPLGAFNGPRVCCSPFMSLAATDGDDLGSFCDPGPAPDNQLYNDVWYRFFATATATAELEVVPFGFIRAAVYEDNGCPADSADVLDCAEAQVLGVETLSFATVQGESYLIRLGANAPNTSFIGTIDVRYPFPAPTNLSCASITGTDVSLNWSLPAGANYDAGINIYRDGALVQIVSGTETSVLLPLTTPILGSVSFCIEGVNSTLGPSEQICCAVSGPPASDTCAFATPLTAGITTFDLSLSQTDGDPLNGFCDPGPSPDDQIYNDVFYCFSASQDGVVD